MIARDISHFRVPVTYIADVENQDTEWPADWKTEAEWAEIERIKTERESRENQDNLKAEMDKVIQQPVLAAEASAPTNEPPSADKHGDMAPPTYNEATAHSTESTAEKLDLSRVF